MVPLDDFTKHTVQIHRVVRLIHPKIRSIRTNGTISGPLENGLCILDYALGQREREEEEAKAMATCVVLFRACLEFLISSKPVCS